MVEPHHMDHGHMDHPGHMDEGLMPKMDGSTIDHSQHSAHDSPASVGSEGGMMHMMMKMYFHLGYNEVILFDFWKISSIGGLIGSMVGIFFMAALYEGLKYYREYLFWKTYNALQYRSVETPAGNKTTPEDKNVVHVVGEVFHKQPVVGEVFHKQPPSMLSLSHGFQTVLHIIQMVISYFLMLIFMTYNVWLCVAVTLGAGTGYFLFGWKKSVIIDVTDHCH